MRTAIERIGMNTTKRTGFAVIVGGALAVAAALTMSASAASPRFYEDDPIWHERDTEDASGLKPLDVDLFVDLTTNLLARTAAADVRAQNVNTVVVHESRRRSTPDPRGGVHRTRYNAWSRAWQMDRHLVQERRCDPGVHHQGREGAALVSEVRSTRLSRDGHAHRGYRDEADVGPGLSRAGEPHRLHAPRSTRHRRRREVHAAGRKTPRDAA